MRRRALLAGGAAWTWLGAAATGSRAARVPYRGFAIDAAALADDPRRDALVRAAEAQVDLVLAVGLSPATLAVLAGYPVHLTAGPGGGHFGRDGVAINLVPQDGERADDRPILLHELLHAYQARLMPGGTANPELRRYFAAAHAPGLWPAGSYMLSNVAEYFAMTASVYLHGSAARPPFTRAALVARQPRYAEWLGRTVR